MNKSIMILTLLLGLLGTAFAAIPIPDDYDPPFRPVDRPLEGLVITVDPGHGGSSFSQGYHGSARGVNSRVVEGDLNMRVSALLYHHLQDAGAQVHMTRLDDRKVTLGATGRAVELGARTQLAEETRSHLFLSIHHNSAARASAHGVVILIWPTDSEGNAQPLERAFADILREEIQKM
ncbi:MAG: N-acetylmuramoyl-L-alanine amidase, partial [Candidatus Sumerlaeia bacterium]|nr:N-acetylmuramoyl-L-alanine amidase [Candidatus Sumerlaeia bacterium]